MSYKIDFEYEGTYYVCDVMPKSNGDMLDTFLIERIDTVQGEPHLSVGEWVTRWDWQEWRTIEAQLENQARPHAYL